MSLSRYISRVLLCIFSLYGVMLILSYVLFPIRPTGPIDINEAFDSIYSTEPKFLIFSINRLARSDVRVLLFGSSNARVGLRPKELSQQLNVSVDNLALDSSNLSEQAQAIDLAYENIPKEDWEQLVIVLGVWYGNFVSDSTAHYNGITMIDIEKLRYGLYAKNEKGVLAPRVSESSLQSMFAIGIRPLLLASNFYNKILYPLEDSIKRLGRRVLGLTPAISVDPNDDTYVQSLEERAISLKRWQEHIGPIDEWSYDGFRDFLDIARKVTARGSRFVVLELPLPPWHRDASAYHRIYEQRMEYLKLEIHKLPGVIYGSMQEGFLDQDFYDATHPWPKTTIKFATKAAQIIAFALR